MRMIACRTGCPASHSFSYEFHHARGVVVARIVRVGDKRADVVAPARVAGLRLLEEAREQAERERMAAEFARRGFQLLVGPPHAVVAQQRRAGLVRQFLDVDDRRGVVPPMADVLDREPAGEHDQAVRCGRRRRREAAQQHAQALVLQLAELPVGTVLQRLDAVENEQRAPPRHRLGDRLALGGGAGRFRLDAELVQRPIEERVRRSRALLRALAVKRPAEHCLRAAIIVGPQSLQPFVDQRRLARAAFGDEREDVGLGIGPGVVEALQLRVAADEAFVGGFGEAADVDVAGCAAGAAGADARLRATLSPAIFAISSAASFMCCRRS